MSSASTVNPADEIRKYEALILTEYSIPKEDREDGKMEFLKESLAHWRSELAKSPTGKKRQRDEEGEELDEEIQKVLDSTYLVKVREGSGKKAVRFFGNAVAVSSMKAVTAVHGKLPVGFGVEILNNHGHKLKGKIGFVKYEDELVDIAVVVLDAGYKFGAFIPYRAKRVKLLTDLVVVALGQVTKHDVHTPSARPAVVQEIIPDSALITSTYYSYDGMSGAGVVTVHEDGEFHLVGVHVASQDATVPFEKENGKRKKKKEFTKNTSPDEKNDEKSSFEERLTILEDNHVKHQTKYQVDQTTISSNLNGHQAYCIICEIIRVEGLVDYLNN